jgi:hypothetical protein
MQLWGKASTSNIEILERFQSKALRMIVDAPYAGVPQVKVMLQQAISQSVCLGVKSTLEPVTRCYILSESCCVVSVGRPL